MDIYQQNSYSNAFPKCSSNDSAYTRQWFSLYNAECPQVTNE